MASIRERERGEARNYNWGREGGTGKVGEEMHETLTVLTEKIWLFKSALTIGENQKLMASDYDQGLDVNCMHFLTLTHRMTMRCVLWDDHGKKKKKKKNDKEVWLQVIRVSQLAPLVFRELGAAAFEECLVQLLPVERCLGATWHLHCPPRLAGTQRKPCRVVSPQGPSATIRASLGRSNTLWEEGG